MEPLALLIAAFAGWLIVSRAPAILHAPLTAGCTLLNATVAVTGLAVLLTANSPAEQVAGFFAVACGAASAAGGYAVGAGSLLKFRAAAPVATAAPIAAVEPRRERRRSSAPRRKPQPKPAVKD